jgi:hypothetical protein
LSARRRILQQVAQRLLARQRIEEFLVLQRRAKEKLLLFRCKGAGRVSA